jgi:hypothetical protein
MSIPVLFCRKASRRNVSVPVRPAAATVQPIAITFPPLTLIA